MPQEYYVSQSHFDGVTSSQQGQLAQLDFQVKLFLK